MRLEKVVDVLNKLETGLSDSEELLEMAVEENDESTLEEVVSDLDEQETSLAQLEFQRMFAGATE